MTERPNLAAAGNGAMTAILANVGVPLFFPQPLLALVALLPVVGVEALILRRAGKVHLRDVFIANVFSAIWGVPLAFISVMVLGYSTGVALDGYYSTLSDVALVMLALVVPCWALSVCLEGWYLRPRSVAWKVAPSGLLLPGPSATRTLFCWWSTAYGSQCN